MNIKELRTLLNQGHSVVLLEDGQRPLMVTELPQQEPALEEVPIVSRWPKGRATTQSAPPVVTERPAVPESQGRQDQVLERLNKEILALKAQITQDEQGAEETR